MATPIRPVMEIDVVFESFICTVCPTISAVAGDSDLLLNRFINEKLDKIQSKLDAYLNMTDFYTAACQDEC